MGPQSNQEAGLGLVRLTSAISLIGWTLVTLLPAWELVQPPSVSPLSTNCLLIGITTCYFPGIELSSSHHIFPIPFPHPTFAFLFRLSPQHINLV